MATQTPTTSFSSPLTTDQLVDVIDLLKRCGFPAAKWDELGLRLGLHKNTLEAIERNNGGDVSRCLTDCLAHWLRRVDNVDSRGGATWDSLLTALQSMNEVAVADELKSYALAIDIFSTHRPTLSQSLTDPIKVADMLKEKGVITDQALTNVKSASPSVPTQHDVLLAAVGKAVQTKYTLLQTFAIVLHECTGNESLGADIQRDYGKVTSPVLGQSECGTSNEDIHVPQYMSKEFNALYDKFANMFSDVREALMKHFPPTSIEELKLFLEDFNSELEAELDNISTLTGVMRLIRKNCSLVDIVILEAVVKRFKITGAQIHLSEYKKAIDESCQNFSISLCLNEPFDVVKSSPLKRETATFVFGWKPNQHKLKDIIEILSKTCGKLVKIKFIKEENSITVTCTFPHSLTEALIAKVMENIDILRKNSLISLTIGYCTVWGKGISQETQPQLLEEEREIIPLSHVKSDDILLLPVKRDAPKDDTDIRSKLPDSATFQKIGIQESLKKKHKIKKQPIEMTLTGPLDASASISDDHQTTFVSDVPALDYYPDLIEVTFDTDIDTDTLQLYFESKRSGGNKTKEVESIKTIEQGVVHVKFESSEDAAAVISQERHSIMKNKKSLVVRYVPVPPVKEYDKSKLLIKDIPKEVEEDLFYLFVENCLGLDHETDFTFELRSGIAVLFFGSSYTDEDFEDIATKLSAKELKKQQVTVERCEVNYSVYVSGITSDAFATKDGLGMYFENPSRSGAGDDVLEKIEILAKGKAKVTFNDCSVIQRVLAKKHEKLGPDVSISECSVLDSFEVSSDNEYESAEEEEVVVKEKPSNKRDNKTGEKSSEELIKSKRQKKKQEDSNSDDGDDTSSPFEDMPPLEIAPAVPMNPIPHPLDPLLAKYVRLKPDVTKGIEREYQVTITAADVGIITISPTPTSPPDWPEKAIKMMHDVIFSSLTKVDIPVPPEVSGTVYPMVMKACNDEGLQYAFGQGSNKVAIVGHVNAVTKLQHDVNEMCSRMIQTTGDVKLSHEDYIYFKSYSLSHIQQMYSAVKFQCHDNDFSVSVNGSIKDVDEVKAQLPQYLRHIKVPVNLQPDAITFLHNDTSLKQELAHFVKSSPNVIPYYSFDDQLVLFLLCPEEFASEAETVAMNIQQDITVQPIDLPQSFSRHVNDLKFASFQTKLSEKYPFSASIQQNKLVLVSTRNSIAAVSKEFQAFIFELCSVTGTINFKKGVWRLIHSTSMEKKWSDLKEEITKKGVTIVSCSKPTVQKPYITVKGEEHNVEYATKEILELQAAVKERQITISRPGICRYFLSILQGQTILRGIEFEANVCIEVEVNKEDTGNFKQSVTPNSRFKKVGFGTTEMKTVNVIVGDITEFKADVIVNVANDQLAHTSGIAGAISQKGGPTIEEESRKYIEKKGALLDGDAVLFTKAGNLPYKAIVHAVGPRWNSYGSNKRETALLKRAVRKSLEKSKHYSSIAIPAISSGIFGFPVDVCANAILEAIIEFSVAESDAILDKINIVIFQDNVDEFLKAAEEHLENFQCSSSSKSAASLLVPSTPPTPTVDDSSSEKFCKIRGSSASVSSKIPLSCKPPIEISNGSIVDFQEEVLVNTTDTDLSFGGFVAKALLKASGPGLQQECANVAKPVNVGSVTVTGGHNLESKHVLHVVLPGYDGPGGSAEKVLRQVVYDCLEECTRLKMKSISMPSIGAGNLKYPKKVVAKALMEETALFFQKNQGKTSLQLVHFVIFDCEVYNEFDVFYKDLLSLISLGEDVDTMHLNFSMDSEAIFIYGETDLTVGRAAKRIQSTIDAVFVTDTLFVTEQMDDASIAEFTSKTVSELKSFALDQCVDIEIDCDDVQHLVKLHGCLQDVLLVKDKVRDAISFINQERSKKAATDAISKTVCWIRLNSQEQEEEYGEELNYYIETAYQNKEKYFDSTEEQFSIDFDTMEEKDMVTKAIVKVKRQDLTKVQEEQPKDWVPMPLDSKGNEKYSHLINLPVSSAEFKNVETNFNQTMTGRYTNIVSIQRLQIPVLYQQYAVRKREIEKRNPKGHQNERWLWHGTSPDTLAKINTACGFDRNFAGKNTTVYGKGVYFARDASYSHGYSASDANSQHHMYYAQVLTGEYTVGNTSMLAPPAKNPQVDANVLFDSTVNNVSTPTIFVVYQDTQCYPAYLISYQ